MSSTPEGNNNIIGKCINDKYIILKQIGQGGFGRVYLCENKYASSQRYAIKMIPLPKPGSSQHHSVDPKAEIEIHRGLAEKKARRFVKILDDFELDGVVHIVMEYCEEGSLKDFLTRHRFPMDILLATDVLLQLVDALRLMHASKIMHRDLTAGNVLIKEISRGRDGNVKRLHVKITDFGLSKRDAQGPLRTMLGTPAFMAPEVRAGKYTIAADVFSLGSIFYLLLTRKYLPGIQQMVVEQHKHRAGVRQQEQHLDLEQIWINVLQLNESIRSLLPEEVKGFLKSFLVGLLCREDSRILLDEIEKSEFIKWYRTNRKALDPEMEELCCSASYSGTPVGIGNVAPPFARRLSRSGGGIEQQRVVPQQHHQQQQQDIINKDSALGSDNPSRSGSSRCRHPQIDPETGRCRTCSYRPTTSSSTRARAAAFTPIPQPNFGGGSDQPHRRWPSSSSNTDQFSSEMLQQMHRPMVESTQNDRRRQILREKTPFNSAGNVPPASRFVLPPPPSYEKLHHTAAAAVAPVEQHAGRQLQSAFSAPIGGCGKENMPGTSSSKKSSVCWPLSGVKNYVAVNEHGRCSFRRPSTDLLDQLQLVAILEKTRSKQDQNIECILEMWQNSDEFQELRLFEPANRFIACPSKSDPLVEKKSGMLAKILSASELATHRLAKYAYETLCGFYRLVESKFIQAYCEEVIGDWKWRLELRWNGYIFVYGGAKTMRDLELKWHARQKTERGPIEEVKSASPLGKARKLLEELSQQLREEVRHSMWRREGTEQRNIRCTIYARGYS